MKTAAAFVVVLGLAASAVADTIWIGTLGVGQPLETPADVIGIERGELIYRLYGNRTSKPLERIVRIAVDGQDEFNRAEEAFFVGEWADAAGAYDKVVRRASEDWVRRRAAERLVMAAASAGQFDRATEGYVTLADLDATAAVGREPEIAGDVPAEQLRAAAAAVRKAVDAVGAEQKKTLLAFLLQIQNKLGDVEAAGRTVEQLGELLGDAVPADAGEADRRLFAETTLGRARLAMSRGEYGAARQIVDGGGDLFVDPQQQSDALMLLADVQAATGDGSRAAAFDAALAYMKIVAHFKRVPGSPNVAEALVRVAELHRDAGEPEAAERVLRQVVEEYPTTAAAERARGLLER